MYNTLYILYSKIPIIVTFAAEILDQIIQIISDEANFLFILTLYILVLYKHHTFIQSEEIAKEFDSPFYEIINKINEVSEKFKKFRSEIKSKLHLIVLPSNLNEYIRFLNHDLKSELHNLKHFNTKNFFTVTKEINGIKIHPSYGKINEEINKALLNENGSVKALIEYPLIREQFNKNFDFVAFEKFTFFRFTGSDSEINVDNGILYENPKIR